MPTPGFDINEVKRRMQGATQSLKHELGGLRTGRAAASMLEPVQVDAYGTHMPLNQLATISVPEPRLLSVQVWDKSMVKAVEKASVDSNLGLSPATDGPDRTDGPLHVAIIMDGNGRWAAARGLPRAEGHRRGVEALRRVVRAANELGVLYLTIFSFSSENWSRPATEIGDLFGLLRRFIRNDLATLHRDGVRVRVIGERAGLESDICALLNEAEELTRANTTLNLVVAFNYGSRQEIANAAQRLAREVAAGKREPATIDADTLGQYLDAPDIPDPDLIIRTSGAQRLSNFLMWQAAYSELVFVPIHWPDFEKAALEDAIAEYARRERRFGGLAAKTAS